MSDAVKNTLRSMRDNAAVICSCFLLTSTAYLAWTYHLMDLVPSRAADALTMVGGYVMQAAGVGLFAVLVHDRGDRRDGRTDRLFYAALVLHMACLVPAATSPALVLTLLFGGLLNLLCGMIGGYYLYRLSGGAGPEAAGSALALGIGYGISTVISWVLSILDGGRIYYSDRVLIICLVLTAAVFVLVRATAGVTAGSEKMNMEETGAGHRTVGSTGKAASGAVLSPETSSILLAGILVLLFSIVNSCGFAFPSADLGKGINLEFARLFYAAGLLIAGFLNERSRRYGAVCALAALVIPFIMLGLRGEMVSLRVFWALSYFTFGFYSVFRMILFVDMARAKKCLYLSGFGLLLGRLGDAAGEALCLSLSDRIPLLVAVSAVFFVAAVFLFFRVYPAFYLFRQPVPAGMTGAAVPAGALAGKMISGYGYDHIDPVDRHVAGSAESTAAAENENDAAEADRPAAAGNAEDHSRQETFERFCARYTLSAREREVLRFLLAEKTNTEIADTLSITEGTVKYHIHNLLQKTGCRNRIVLLSLYYTGEDE